MCDACMRSGVEIARTDKNGNTVCVECDKGSDGKKNESTGKQRVISEYYGGFKSRRGINEASSGQVKSQLRKSKSIQKQNLRGEIGAAGERRIENELHEIPGVTCKTSDEGYVYLYADDMDESQVATAVTRITSDRSVSSKVAVAVLNPGDVDVIVGTPRKLQTIFDQSKNEGGYNWNMVRRKLAKFIDSGGSEQPDPSLNEYYSSGVGVFQQDIDELGVDRATAERCDKLFAAANKGDKKALSELITTLRSVGYLKPDETVEVSSSRIWIQSPNPPTGKIKK